MSRRRSTRPPPAGARADLSAAEAAVGGEDREDRALVAAARDARRRAYAPYSRFRVGAAVRAGGAVHLGCNVENASYGLTVCAERNAVGAAAVAGARRIDAIAVASGTSPPTPPCGACLQTLAELGAPDTPVLLAGARGAPVRTTLGALLPHAFTKRYL